MPDDDLADLYREGPRITSAILSEQVMEDLLVGALEGGSNYWYFLPDLSMVPKMTAAAHDLTYREPGNVPVPTSIRIFRAAMKGAKIPVTDLEEENTYGRGKAHVLGYITREGMEGALSKMLRPVKGNRRQAAEIIADNIDGDAADVWFQFSVMGEQVYA
jgi:hypothetical protein